MFTYLAPRPTVNYDAYRVACAEAAQQPAAAWGFKHDPRYTRVLEHVTPAQGEAYLAAIQTDFPDVAASALAVLREWAPRSDALGHPAQWSFSALGGVPCSPTNLRYLYQALCVWRQLRVSYDEHQHPRRHIVELGGGYGGLAVYLRATQPLMDPALRPLRHTLVDVPEAGALQRAYLRAAGLTRGLRFVNGLDATDLRRALRVGDGPRLFVSVFAFSEFDEATRAWYAARLVRRCPHGYLVWNCLEASADEAGTPFGGPVYPLTTAPLTVELAPPGTEPGTVVVAW